MELGVSHVQNLSSSTPIVDNIFDKYNKNLVPIRSLSDHDNTIGFLLLDILYRHFLGGTLNFQIIELHALLNDSFRHREYKS